jgi:uncharacterized protein
VFVSGEVLLERCVYSPSLFFRLKGLLGYFSLPPQEGLWLKPCNGIHMFFMKFPIDAVFLDRQNRIIKIAGNARPWRVIPFVGNAYSVVEMSAYRAQQLRIGDVLEFKSVTSADKEKV